MVKTIAGGVEPLTEFKQEISSPDSFTAKLIAFANTEGGQIFLDVDDSEYSIIQLS